MYPPLVQEWNKILNATGFYQGFWNWMNHQPELLPMPWGLPTASYLYTIEQLLKHHADDLASHLQKKAKNHAEFLQQQDLRRFGKRMAFKYLREPSPGLIQTVDTKQTDAAKIKTPLQYGLTTVSVPTDQEWDLLKHVTVNDHKATIVTADPGELELMIHDDVDTLPHSLEITQSITTANPTAVSQELSKF